MSVKCLSSNHLNDHYQQWCHPANTLLWLSSSYYIHSLWLWVHKRWSNVNWYSRGRHFVTLRITLIQVNTLNIYFVGNFLGALSSVPAHTLGATAIKEALKRASVDGADVSEVILGQVLTAGMSANSGKTTDAPCFYPIISVFFPWGLIILTILGLGSLTMDHPENDPLVMPPM